VAGLVGAAADDHGLGAVPAPGKAESGLRLGEHRVVQAGLLPGLPAVRAHLGTFDAPIARPREAADLDEALADGVAGAGERDEALRQPREGEVVHRAVLEAFAVVSRLVLGLERLRGELDAAEPLDLRVALPA